MERNTGKEIVQITIEQFADEEISLSDACRRISDIYLAGLISSALSESVQKELCDMNKGPEDEIRDTGEEIVQITIEQFADREISISTAVERIGDMFRAGLISRTTADAAGEEISAIHRER